MKTPPPGSASEKRPNSPVNIQPEEPIEEYVDILEIDSDLAPDSDLFGSDDLIGIDVVSGDDDAND